MMAHPWTTARLEGDRLRFERSGDLARALTDGFFFVEAPASISLEAGDRFARNFYLARDGGPDDAYRAFRRWTPETLAPRQGYFDRAVDQVEQFFLESAHWRAIFPPELEAQARAMRRFGIDLLRAVFAELAIPRELWDTASGACLSGRGAYHLTFNHFRPEIDARGLNVHKDSGWVTVLRSREPGLEVLCGGAWRSIDPRPGHFIVNFGCAIEILTRCTRPLVAAVAHRVRRQRPHGGAQPDRFSYAMFLDSSLDPETCQGLYRYQPGRGLVHELDFGEFLTRIVDNTYQHDTQGLYDLALDPAADPS